jgi:transcriptional regulator with XRE-family HTH domain
MQGCIWSWPRDSDVKSWNRPSLNRGGGFCVLGLVKPIIVYWTSSGNVEGRGRLPPCDDCKVTELLSTSRPMVSVSLNIGEIFAANLRAIRRAKGVSQVDLANSSGLSTKYIGRLERAEKSPTLKTVEAISYALSIEPAELLAPVPGREMKTGKRSRPAGVVLPPRHQLAAAIDKNTAELAELRNEIRHIQDALMHRR